MLFLVVSTPRPEPPTSINSQRKKYWQWLAPLQASGTCKSIYARVGRGAVAILDVDGNETLHRLLNEWADIIPAQFDVYPLIDTGQAQQYLAQQSGS